MIPELLLLILFTLDLTSAQTTTTTCTADFNWAYNDLQPAQSPCLVAAYLGHQCAPDASYNVPVLTSGQQYLPPTGQQANICQCSSVYYSLLSACAECQRSSLDTFTVWTHSCAQGNISVQSYPLATPSGTHIPPWAYLPLSNGAFDVISAGKNATGDPNFGNSGGADLSMGAIIGLTIGCVVALMFVVVALWLYLRMRTIQRVNAESKQQSMASDRTAFRYGKIEGPPRKPRTFLVPSTTKVVSYRPGLNFDLDKGRRGDLLELNESAKLTRSKGSSNEPSVESTSAYMSKISLDSSVNHSKKLEHHSEPGTSQPITSLFSRAKEVKPQRGEARLDLTEPGEEPRRSGGPSPSNSDGGEYHQEFPPRLSGGRRPGPGILDM